MRTSRKLSSWSLQFADDIAGRLSECYAFIASTVVFGREVRPRFYRRVKSSALCTPFATAYTSTGGSSMSRTLPSHFSGNRGITRVDILEKVLEKLATSQKTTIVIDREIDGKMRVTSGSWGGSGP
jgi:hypothetical protein